MRVYLDGESLGESSMNSDAVSMDARCSTGQGVIGLGHSFPGNTYSATIGLGDVRVYTDSPVFQVRLACIRRLARLVLWQQCSTKPLLSGVSLVHVTIGS